ncbi:putative glutathione S-transferase GSTF1 [Apostasia shenzhenica]|uniref:glutathione transferase n=1 Tax=Apostasia shenzhenica TaxID=1088818 RepID=A0A2I0ACZ7_9ASPA|nr:putative glutathione S-transferase GSTF1 [Apostasia shenzhenica]
MAVRVFGLPKSTCTSRVLLVLEELGVEYELVPVNFAAGEHKQHPYLERNPFGQLPAFQDGDLSLFESRVITRYLVRKYGKDSGLLKETAPEEAAAVDQWMEVETAQFNPAICAIVFQIVILPIIFGGTTDEKVVEAQLDKLGKVLDVYEARLSKSKYLAGESYTLADIHHISYIHYFLTATPHASFFDSRPHVKAWWEAISSRPAIAKITAGLSFK